MKILCIGASSSAQSINHQLASYVGHQMTGGDVHEIKLSELHLPIYSEDIEKENGIPQAAKEFMESIKLHDGIVISLAEHNGSYTAAFKNLYDWCSRIDQQVWQNKPMLLLSTSPGVRGGQTVMDAAKSTFPRMGANLKASFSLPSFYENFSSEKGLTNESLKAELEEEVKKFMASFERE